PHRLMQALDANGDGQITREEFQKVDLFDLLDTNHDGVLNRDDFPARGMHGPEHLLRLADEDRDGTITAAEWSRFLAAIDPDNKGVVDREAVHALMKERFAKLHPDSAAPERGPFSDREGREAPPELTIETLNEMFKQLDKNGDGALSSDELPQW